MGGANSRRSGVHLSENSEPPVTVKVFPITTGQTFGADQAILDQLKTGTNLTMETTDLQECDFIIVFCPITSRVGSDVAAAMTKVPGGKPVVLVLMHHTRDFNYLSDEKRWSEHNQNIVLDVHVLFHESVQGLLTCPRNDEAVRQIQGELKNLKPADPKKAKREQATVKVYPIVAGDTCGAERIILDHVKERTNLTVETITDLQECDIIIIFFPMWSHTVSEKEAAMTDVPVSSDGKPVKINLQVLIHPTRDANYLTGVEDLSGKYENIVLDVKVVSVGFSDFQETKYKNS